MSRPSACIDSNKNDLSASTSLAAAFLSTKRIDQVTYLWLSPDKTYLYDTKLSLLTPAFLAAAQAASSALFKASIVISSFFKFLNSSLKMNNVSATRTASTKPARSYFFHIEAASFFASEVLVLSCFKAKSWKLIKYLPLSKPAIAGVACEQCAASTLLPSLS